MRQVTLQEMSAIRRLFPAEFYDQPKRKPSVRPKVEIRDLDFQVQHLQAPLFNVNDEPEAAISDVTANVLEVHAYIPALDDAEGPIEWTNDGIYQLHSDLLFSSLQALAGRGNGEQKREILEWIFEPDYVDTVVKNGRPVKVLTKDVPWTFAFCCRLERVVDPDVIRDFIRRLLPEGCVHFH